MFILPNSTIRLIMKFIFIINLFGEKNVGTNFYKFGQRLQEIWIGLNLELYSFQEWGSIIYLFIQNHSKNT